MQIQTVKILAFLFGHKERTIFGGSETGLDIVVLEFKLLQGQPADHGFLFGVKGDVDGKLVLVVAQEGWLVDDYFFDPAILTQVFLLF